MLKGKRGTLPSLLHKPSGNTHQWHCTGVSLVVAGSIDKSQPNPQRIVNCAEEHQMPLRHRLGLVCSRFLCPSMKWHDLWWWILRKKQVKYSGGHACPPILRAIQRYILSVFVSVAVREENEATIHQHNIQVSKNIIISWVDPAKNKDIFCCPWICTGVLRIYVLQ